MGSEMCIRDRDNVQEKYESYGKHVEVVGLNQASVEMRERLAGKLAGH